MDNPLLNKQYSTSKQKWSEKENILLLEELRKDYKIEKISKNHDRIIEDVQLQIEELSYTMYKKNVTIDEIIKKTKLTKEEIYKIIEKKRCYCSIC